MGELDLKKRWNQQFTFSDSDCGARPIRWTADPSKCVDAVHPTKVLLTDCSGVDSQKFLFRCEDPPRATAAYPTGATATTSPLHPIDRECLGGMRYDSSVPKWEACDNIGEPQCYIQAFGGRKDMCLWWQLDSDIDASV